MSSPAFPLEVEPPHEVKRMNARERYLELFDAGDQYDEELGAEWDALDNPTRPRDSELLPK